MSQEVRLRPHPGTVRMHSRLDNEMWDEADDPEEVLIDNEEAAGIGAASSART
jgi:hypothetical protein